MGILNQQEADSAIAIARSSRGVKKVIPLDTPAISAPTPFIEVLENRKSIYEFGVLELISLGHFLYLSNRFLYACLYTST